MTKTITKIKYDEGLRWPLFDNLHAKTNQKHVGMTEGGLDRLITETEKVGKIQPELLCILQSLLNTKLN
jgi:hypothetical protein